MVVTEQLEEGWTNMKGVFVDSELPSSGCIASTSIRSSQVAFMVI